jgi:hypothetical protein
LCQIDPMDFSAKRASNGSNLNGMVMHASLPMSLSCQATETSLSPSRHAPTCLTQWR